MAASTPETAKRDAALSITTDGTFEVELFGPVTLPSGEITSGHHYRRHVDSPEEATAMVQWWLDDGPMPDAIREATA